MERSNEYAIQNADTSIIPGTELLYILYMKRIIFICMGCLPDKKFQI